MESPSYLGTYIEELGTWVVVNPKEKPNVHRMNGTKSIICKTMSMPFDAVVDHLYRSLTVNTKVWPKLIDIIGDCEEQPEVIITGWIRDLFSASNSKHFKLICSGLLLTPMIHRFSWINWLQSNPIEKLNSLTSSFNEYVGSLIITMRYRI
jgi:hypothetical protein